MQKIILPILIGLFFFMAPTVSIARESKADLAGYCTQKFGATAFASVDRRDNGLLCSVRTDGGMGLTHNKIRADDVCSKQYDTRSFRRDGQDIICLKRPGDNAIQADRSIDLEKYCKKAYGANAFPTVRRTDNTPMCSVRTDGGLGLRHYIIDTTSLCNGATPRSEGKTLYCGGKMADGAASPSSKPKGNGVPAPSTTAGSRKPSDGKKPTTSTEDRTSVVAASCQSLGGKWRSGTLSLVSQIKSDMDQKVSRRTPALSTSACTGQYRQSCLSSIGAVISDAYMNIIMIWQCHLAVIQNPQDRPGDDLNLAEEEACTINETLDQLADQLIATNLYPTGAMDPPIHTRLLEARKMTGFCKQEYVEDEM